MERDVFLGLGGFDDVYIEGYWEDTDLAMRIRQAGKDVLVQPLSIIYHQEGRTFGTDGNTSAVPSRKDTLMAQNGKNFMERLAPDFLKCMFCIRPDLTAKLILYALSDQVVLHGQSQVFMMYHEKEGIHRSLNKLQVASSAE